MHDVQDNSVLCNNAVRPVESEDWLFAPMLRIVHDRIISPRGDVWAHKIPQRFIEVPVSSRKGEWSCICVLDVSILFLSMIALSMTLWHLFCF